MTTPSPNIDLWHPYIHPRHQKAFAEGDQKTNALKSRARTRNLKEVGVLAIESMKATHELNAPRMVVLADLRRGAMDSGTADSRSRLS
jgi:hypothetical protein